MGEMADYYIESYQNAAEDELWDNDHEETAAYTIKTSTCKYCYEPKLHWEKNKGTGKWRLHNKEGEMHVCIPYIMEEL